MCKPSKPRKVKKNGNPKDLIKINQNFSNKEEAINYCGKLLVDGGYVNSNYVSAMLDRDKELSVYMGNFIAIPHGTDSAKKKF